ncbi:MAG TPA: SIMPL domain-containing protein, partial [Methylomirabilota bacterium]|nr:SIMPL domain-containing protein [Methylomirabilota bacterium]
MHQTIRTAGALAIGALIVAVAALAVRPGAAAGAPATNGEPALHTITVTGTGSVTRVPDVARVSVGVSVTKASVKGARESAGKSMQDIIAAIKAMGIDEKDIKTTSIDLSPQYSNSSTPRIIGYRMSEQLQVTVRDLDKSGDVVDTATAKGATEVNGLWFEVGDPDSATDEARAAAIAQARTSAQKMASAAGVS